MTEVHVALFTEPRSERGVISELDGAAFWTVREAQEYLRDIREKNGLPCANVEPTSEENEEWIEREWEFAIITLPMPNDHN